MGIDHDGGMVMRVSAAAGWQVEFVDGPLYGLISSLLCTNRCEAITLSSVQASTTEMNVIRIFWFNGMMKPSVFHFQNADLQINSSHTPGRSWTGALLPFKE